VDGIGAEGEQDTVRSASRPSAARRRQKIHRSARPQGFPSLPRPTARELEEIGEDGLRRRPSARARAGVTFSENKGLLFVSGGGAWAGVKVSEFNAGVGLPPIVYGTESRTLSGWTAGAGLEWVLLGPLTAKVEYLYMQLNKKRFFEDCGCLASDRDVDARQHIMRLGLNYRFTP